MANACFLLAAHVLFSSRYTENLRRGVVTVAVIMSLPDRLMPCTYSILSTSSHCGSVGSFLCLVCISISLSFGLISSALHPVQNLAAISFANSHTGQILQDQ